MPTLELRPSCIVPLVVCTAGVLVRNPLRARDGLLWCTHEEREREGQREKEGDRGRFKLGLNGLSDGCVHLCWWWSIDWVIDGGRYILIVSSVPYGILNEPL